MQKGRKGAIMPKLKDKRISGTGYDPETMEGKAALRRLKFEKISKDGKHHEIDTAKIEQTVLDYINIKSREYKQYIYKNKGKPNEEVKEVTLYKPVSEAGIRIALDNICPQTYRRWLKGYVSQEDMENEDVECNLDLCNALRAGENEIARYLFEDEDSNKSSITIRRLETLGEITPSKSVIDANIWTGKIPKPKNWKRGSK